MRGQAPGRAALRPGPPPTRSSPPTESCASARRWRRSPTATGVRTCSAARRRSGPRSSCGTSSPPPASSASTSPPEYGGGGGGMTALAAVGEELASRVRRCCSSSCRPRSPAVLARHGSPEQQERWLRGIGRGDLKMAFAITEPDAGSNSHNLATTATRDGDVYSAARDRRRSSPASTRPPRMLVVARTGDATPTAGPGAAVALRRRHRRARARRARRSRSRSAAPRSSTQLFFDDVEVPADRLIGDEGEACGRSSTASTPSGS